MEMQGQQKTKNRSFIHRLLLTTVYLLPACFGLLLTTVYLLLSAPSAHAGTIVKGPAYLGLQNGLVGCWTFDGASSYAQDCSGNGAIGTLSGPTSIGGQLGQGLSFDGVNDYVSVLNTSTNLSSAGSWGGWVKFDRTSGVQRIIFKDSGSQGIYELFLNNVGFETEIVVGTSRYEVLGLTGSVQSNKWYHLFATYDGETLKLYINGALINSNGTMSGSLDSNTSYLGLGNRVSDPTTYPLAGTLDDVRIFNRALTANEIARMYKIGLGSKNNRAEGGDQFDKGLVAHWTFDGTDISGTRAKDRSGRNNHGTITGAAQIGGRIGQALTFDGIDDDVTGTISAVSAPLTLSVWVYLLNTASTEKEILELEATDEVSLTYGVNSKFLLWSLASGNSGYVQPNATPVANRWYHLAAVLDGSSNPTLYVDGVNAGSKSTGVNPQSMTGMRVGVWSGGGRSCNCIVDDVRVYSRAFTSAEVKRLYDITQPKVNVTQSTLDKGLVGHWTFDGADIGLSGTQAKDRSGNISHGTLTNGPELIGGKVGQALNFDGVDDYVIAGTGSMPVATIAGAITISVWAKTSSSAGQSIIGNRRTSGSVGGYGFSINSGGTTKLRFTYYSILDWDSASGASLADGQWHHYVVTNPTSGVVSFYRDGVLHSTAASAAPGASTNIAPYLGAINYEGTPTGYFNGSLDDIRVYSRALSAGEVNKLYQMGR